MQPSTNDQEIRKEVGAALKINPAASLDTVLSNWRYRRHGVVEEAETARVGTILEDEQAAMIKRQLNGEDRPWWRIW
jgi:hypothetical protein